MKQLIAILVLFFFANTNMFGQDYVVDRALDDEYTGVYKLLPQTSNPKETPEKIYGVINSEKKIIVPIAYKNIELSGEKGIFRVIPEWRKVGLFSAITNKVIVEPKYGKIDFFSEGLAVVGNRSPDDDWTFGVVDVNGNLVIPVEYVNLCFFKEGLINFQKEEDGLWGFLDKNNKVVIPAMYYNRFSSFNDGLALVQVSEEGRHGRYGGFGFIDKNNKMVIAADYEHAMPFKGGFTSVAKGTRDTVGGDSKTPMTVATEWVLIDKTGKIIQERTFDGISPLQAGGLFIIEWNGKKGTMNTKGMPILPIEYSYVGIDTNGYTVFKTIDTKKYGMMNNIGSIIVAPNYDYVSPTLAGRFYVKQDGKYTVVDVNNNVFVQPDSANGVILGKKRIVYYYTDKVKIFDLNGNLQKTFTGLNLKSWGHSLSKTEDSIKLNTDNAVQFINLTTNTKKPHP